MENEQLKQLAEYRKQLRLNTIQNLMNKETALSSTNLTAQNQTATKEIDETVIEPKKAGFVERFTETNIDLLGNVGKGLVSFLEGGYDLIPSIIGTVGGWFSDDFKNKVKEHVAYDFSDDVFSWLNEAADDSYINEMGDKGQTIVRGVHEAVGAMLPSVIAAIATSGGSTPQLVSQIASLGTMFVGAAGQSTEEAIHEGADLSKATAYGIASGAAEAALEKVGGYVPWDDIAKTGGKIFGKEVAKSALGKAAVTFASEGVEEVASDVLNPALKRITGVDNEAKIEVEQLPLTFAIGGLAGVTMGGVNRVAANLRYAKEGGSQFIEMSDELNSIQENEKKLASMQRNKKYTTQQIEDYSKRVDTDNYESLKKVSDILKSLPANKRANAFKTATDLHSIFDVNGDIKADIQSNFNDVSNMNVSAGIRHQTNRLNKQLEIVNTNKGTNFELDTDALNADERKTFAKVDNAVARLAESTKYKAYAGVDIAIIKTNKTANAFIRDGVLYLSREHLTSGQWAKAVAHEITHFAEGSKEFNNFAKFLTADANAVDTAAKAIANQGYGFTADYVKDVLRKVESGEKLNARESEAYSELVAHIAEEMLGNEDSINRLVAKNKSLANRIYERIKSFIRALQGTNADRKTMQKLWKAEQLFSKALKNVGQEKAEAVLKAQNEQKNTAMQTAAQFSLKIINGEKVVFIDTDQDIFDGADVKDYPKIVRKYMLDKFRNKVFPVGTSATFVNRTGIEEYAYPANTRTDESLKENKLKAGTELDNLLVVAEFVKHESDDGRHPDAVRGWDKYKTKFTFDGKNIFEGEISIKLIAKGDLFYDLTKIKNTSAVRVAEYPKGNSTSDKGVLTTSNISQGKEDVKSFKIKTQFSLKPTEYKKVLDNLNEFKTIDELKAYFGEVQSEINEEARNVYPVTMKDISDTERNRVEKIIEAANLEKKAIKEYRKLHSKKPKVDLKTKAQIEAIDKKYTEAIKANDLETAKYLVEQMAILKGYAVTDYQIDHKAPTNDGYNARLDDVTPMYGEDIYSTNAVRYFGTFEGFDNESIRHIQEAKGKPNKTVTVYRAVPNSIKGDQIRNGDWITLTYDYAKNHGEANIIGNYRVIRKNVKASEIFTDGNSIHEFGYDDGKEYYYGNTTNYRKLADVITFDDEGNPIHLIDRFNYRTDDVRFSRKEETAELLSKGFSASDLEFYFDSLSLEELTELVADLEIDDPILTQTESYIPALSKQERRDQYIAKLYEQGKLNEVVTKLVKSKPQMAKYFANTKMNNKYNPLFPSKGDEYIVMFHGTPEQFNVFNTKKVGAHGSVMGSGIYFTKSLSYAEDYKGDDNGRIIATLLNIEKPLSRNSHTFSKADLKKFIREVVDAEGDDFLSNYGDVSTLGYEKLLNIAIDKVYDYNRNDADIIEDIYITSRMDFDKFHDGLTKVLGYDGIIAWNKAEGTQAVIFRSNQAKDIFNFAPTSSSDIRFSRKSFAEQVDDVLNGADTVSTHLQVRETTPQIFLDVGLENKPMLITSTHTKTAVNKKVPNKNIHALSRETLKKLPELLENPAIVMDSTKEGSIVAFVNAVDEDNNPVLCAIKINGTGNYNNLEISSNIVTSVYGKDANPVGFIEKAVNENRLLYWNKKMSQELFETPGLQLPDNLNNFGSNVIIRKSKYLVNSFDENSSEKFSRKAKEPQETTQILTEIPKEQTSAIQKAKDAIRDAWINAQINFTDEQAGIVREGKRLGVEGIEAETNYVRAAYNAAQNMLENEFNLIWDKVYEQGDEYRSEFYEYLMNYHNIDRVAVGKELLANTTPADSRKNIVQLETKHPEFKELAKDVWNYTKTLQQYRVEMGLITQEQADYMNAMYPHYVPTFRAETGGQGVAGTSGKYSIKVKSTIKTAKGSTSDILPPDVFIARQTMEVFRAGRVNMLAKKLYDAAVNSKDFTNISVADIKQRWQPNRTNKQLKLDRAKANEILELMDDDYISKEKKQNQVTFFNGAETVTMAVTPDIYAGFDSFSPNTEYRNTLLNLVTGANNVFKKLVTSASPFFLVRNFFRDLQEAAFYTKHGVKFAPALMRAYKGILSNSDMWQKYLAAGGLSTGLFDYNTGVKRYKGIKAAAKLALNKLEFANMIVEQAPRFAEFMLSMEKGATIQQALLDSAEVTTNFSRGGKFAKFLNKTAMPFLNPSIQGWSKLYRTVVGKKATREWMELILKALILGIGATAINDLLNGGDEEYESLSIRDKENYYLFKIGDTFLKIPKGRVVSVFGSLYLRAKETAKGNENAWDGYLSSVSSAVSPIDSFTRSIFSPLSDAATNTTWYGGQIEGRRLENLAPEDRYDESTSSIAIFLGKTFNYSPKKIHYVIDQYSGVIGDIVLPLTTKKAERGILASNFTIDPTLSNRYSNEFYTALDEATYAKNAGDINATYIARYLNSIAGEVSDMYAEKRVIENSDKSRVDKSAETKVIQALINSTNKSAVENIKNLENALNTLNVTAQNATLQNNKQFLKLDEQAQKRAIQKLNDYYYALALNKAFGTELEAKYEKYAEFNSVDLFVYLTEISAIESDKDKQGNAISGSRKSKIINYLKSKNVTGTKQYNILEILGYSTNN